MKKKVMLFMLTFFTLKGFSQLTISNGGEWVNSGNVTVTLLNMDLINNGVFFDSTGIMRFTGSSDNTIGGNSVTPFNELEVSKTGNSKITLLTDTRVNGRVNFITGLLELNQNNLSLASTGYLNKESETSRITGINGGEVLLNLKIDNPLNFNPGNLGLIITTTEDLGTVVIKRGHKKQVGAGLLSSINRYYDIQSENNTNLNATLKYQYFDAEMNSQNENALDFFKSLDAGTSWTNQSFNTRNITTNFVEKTNVSSFSKWTLSSSGAGTLPVIGLEFYAKRISNNMIQLDWKTIQEINNKGFHIERKKETEASFSNIDFVNSNAIGGNSITPLTYHKTDNNNFTGKTYYRLKQEDIDGRVTYSVIRLVNGNPSNQLAIKVWPVPSTGFFNVIVNGLDKTDTLQVIDMNGRLIKSFVIKQQTTQVVTGLPAGVYFIRLASDKSITQKVVVQ